MFTHDTGEFSSCGWNDIKILGDMYVLLMDRCPLLPFSVYGDVLSSVSRDLIFCWFMSILGSLISLLPFLLSEPLPFFPSGAYFSLFCLSFSVSDTSAPASLDVQCDRWNMTGEKKESFSSPREWKGDLQTFEQKREESSFLCAEYSAQQETQHI